MFIKLLKFHRLIEKGNGMKAFYYISMMLLKKDNKELYKKVLEWSYQYPKDILQLAKLSSMFGCDNSMSKISIKIPMSLKYKTPQKINKGKLGKKMTKWALTESKSGNVISSISTKNPQQTIYISDEIELYAQSIVNIFKQIITGKLFDDNINLMFFKYLSYETGHWAIESSVIWHRVLSICQNDGVIKAALLVSKKQTVI